MNVLLIDDHSLFREGLALLLQPLVDDLVVWEAGSCEQAFELLADRGAADLVLVDMGLPGMHGLQGIEVLRSRWPGCTVVALSSADDRDTVLRAVEAGAMGFVPKSTSAAVLLAALKLILARGIYLPPSAFLGNAPPPAPTLALGHASPGQLSQPMPVALGASYAAGVAAVWAAPQPSSPGDVVPADAHRRPADLGLTPRQGEVLYLILQGKPAKLIERELSLSPSSVKAHTSAVLRALNVTTRTQAVVRAGQLGLRFR